jgi:hypothetical protein
MSFSQNRLPLLPDMLVVVVRTALGAAPAIRHDCATT